MPPKNRPCEDSDDWYLGYRLLFGMAVVATVVVLVITATVYIVTVALLNPASFEKPEEAKSQQR